MPAFLHFYAGYTHETYKRIPRRLWVEMTTYMQEYYKAMNSGR